MARHEHDKEDLIADATVLVDRAEYRLPRGILDGCLVTVGFRDSDQLSVYFEQDPFYQYDADGRLRRGLEDGYLYRSQTQTLARMHRERDRNQTMLIRHDLTTDELAAFRQRMRTRITGLADVLASASVTRGRHVLVSDDFEERLQQRLVTIMELGEDFLSAQINQR
ncbi:MAG: hypothetical protein NXI04_05810 [Planctomycetaceae bacterium]|nr:hypothetical protein [Planctomycetaceae bacterium]